MTDKDIVDRLRNVAAVMRRSAELDLRGDWDGNVAWECEIIVADPPERLYARLVISDFDEAAAEITKLREELARRDAALRRISLMAEDGADIYAASDEARAMIAARPDQRSE